MKTCEPFRCAATVYALILTLHAVSLARIIYVDDNAAGANNGSSWAGAYRFLQDALTDANDSVKPVEIRVAQGTYRPDEGHSVVRGNRKAAFALVDDVSVRGGFAGVLASDPEMRDVDAYPTVLSGDLLANDLWADQSAHVASEVAASHSDNSECIVNGSHRGPTTVLDGFRIEGAAFSSETTSTAELRRGGLYVSSGRPTVNHCLFTKNLAPGVMNADGGNLTLAECKFIRNHYCQGAAVTNAMSDLTVTQCVFEDNSPVAGGAVENRAGDVVIRDSLFAHNIAVQQAGAVLSLGGKMHVTGCDFRRNAVTGLSGSAIGGALYACNSCDAVLDDCTFSHNSSSDAGGAVGVRGGTLTIATCDFHLNTGDVSGGAVWASSEVDVTVTGSVFVANRAWAGGALSCITRGLRFRKCLFAGNRCQEWGGAIFFAGSGTAQLDRCTLQGNHAESGRGSALRGGLCNVDVEDSIVWDINAIHVPGNAAVSIAYSNVYDRLSGAGNISIDPGFAMPGYWDPNRTPECPNDDFWVDGDYHLKSQAGRWDPAGECWVQDDVTSPCIDAGDPNGPIGCEPFPNGGRINMGAYGGTAEASKSYFGGPPCKTIIAGDINGDCRVDFKDFQILASHWWRSDVEDAWEEAGPQR